MLSTVSVQKLVRYGQLGLLGTSNAATTTTAGTSDAAANTNTLNYASFIRRSYVDTAKKVADGADVSVNVAVLTSGELWKSALDSLVATAVHARTVPDGLIAAAVFTSAMCAHERSLATTTAARKVELNTLLASVTSVISLLNRSNTSESLLLAQCFATLVNVASEMCLLDMGSSNNKASSTENGQQSVPAQLLVAAANQFQRLSGGFLLPKVFAPKLAGQQLRGLLRLKPEESGVGSPYQYWSLMQRLAVLVESDALDTATKMSIHDLVAPYLGTRTARYFVYLRGGEAGSGGGATGSGRSARSNASGAGGNGPLIGGGLGGGDERMVLAGCKDIAVQSSPLAFICTPPVDPDVLGELLFLSKVVANAGTAAATQSVSITSDQLTSEAIRRSFSTNSSVASKTRDVSTLLCSWAASVGLVFDGFCDSPSWSLFAVEQRRKVVAKRLKDQERQSKKALKEQEREVQRKIKARAIEALVQARAEEAKANLELRTNALNKNAAEAGSDDDEKMSMTGSNVGSTNSSAVSAAPSWAFSAGGMSRAESDVRSMMSAASFASYSTFLSVVDSEALDREHREQHESADGNSNLPLILMEMGSFALYQCIEAVREEKLLIPYFQQIFRKDAGATAALATYSTQLEGLYTALWRAVTDLFASAARRMRVGLSTGSSGAQVPFFSLADDVQYNCGLGYQSLGLIFARLIVPSLLSEATEDRLTAPPPFMGTVAARARRARIALSSLVTESPELATQFRRDLQRTEAAHMAHALVVYETVAPQVINQNIGAVFTVCCRIAEDESCEESTREGFSTLMRSIINRLGQANQLQLLVKAVVDGVAKKKGSGKDAESDDDEDEQDPEVTAGVVEAEDRKLSATLSNLTTLQQTAISTSEDAQTLLSSAAFRQAFASAVSDTLDTEALLVSVVAEFQRAMTCTDSETCVTSLVVTMHMISITLQGLNPSTFASFPVFEKLIELEVAVGHELLASVVAPALFGTSSSDDGGDAPSTKAIFAATSKKALRGAFVLGCEVLVRVRNAMLNCMSDLAVESLKDVISMINETVWRIGAGAVPTLVGTAPADDDDGDSSTAAALTTDSIVGCVSKSTVTPLTSIHFSHVFAKLASQRLYMYDQIAVLEGTPAAPEQHRAAYATFVSEQNALRVNDGDNNKHPSEVYTLRITAEENFHLSHANTIAQTASPSAAAVSATSLEAAVKQTIANSTLGAVSFMNFLEASSSVEITKAVQASENDSIPIAKLAAILAKSVSTASSNSSKVVCGHLLTRFYNICASVPIQTGSTCSNDDNKCCVAHGFIREILNLLSTSDSSDNDDSSSVRSGLFSVLLLGSTDSKDAKPVSYILPRHTHRFPTHPLLSATTKIFKQLMKYALNAVFNGERSSSSSVHLVYARAFAVLATQYVPIIFERDTVATMVAKAVTKTTNDKVTALKYDSLSVDAIVGDVAIFVALDTIAAAVAEKVVGDAEENSGDEDSDDDEDEKKKKKKGNNKRRAAAEITSVYGAPIKALLAALQLKTISTTTTNIVDVCVFESSPQLLAGHVKHTGFVYTTMYALVSNTMHDAISHGRLSHALRTLLHLRTVPTVAFSNLYPCVLAVLSQFTQQLTASSSTPAKTLAALRNYRDGALELSCYPLVSFFTGAMGGAVFTAAIGTIDAMIQVAADLLNTKSISIAEHVATIQHVITTTSHIVSHHPNVVFGTRSATLPCLMRSIFQGVMRALEAESTSSSSSSSSTSITSARGDAASALVPFNTLLARCTGTVSGNSGASSGTTNFDDAVSTSVYTCNAGTGPRAMVCAAIASALLSSVNKAAQLVMFSSHSEQFDMLGKELLVAMGRARLPRASVARCVYVASQAAPQAPPIGFKRTREENTKKESKKKEEGDDEDSNSDDDENDQPSAPLQAPSKSGKKLPIIKNRRRLEASKIAANSLTARTTYVSLCYAAIGNTDGQQLLHQLSLRVNDETGRSIFNVSK